MQKKKSKLDLKKTTIRNLSGSVLTEAVGGKAESCTNGGACCCIQYPSVWSCMTCC